ncbi:MAG: hypothetical protein M3082_00955, partial [Candidatus Dormibacteraeota bacterium]|nr:hypothetical protein [Candidatus Dormibacteraeota bacterium]
MSLQALEELKGFRHWVGWKIEPGKDGKPTKVPYVANNGRKAKTNNPATWTRFASAAPAYKGAGHNGLGFVVALDDPFCGIDLDHCRNPETGAIDEWAKEIIERFNSYTEITPSETGLRIWIKARKLGSSCEKAMGEGGRKLEIYDHLRFFTVTGAHLDGTPETIEDRQGKYDQFYDELWPEKPSGTASRTSPTTSLTAYEILDLARQAKNAAKWDSLMRG